MTLYNDTMSPMTDTHTVIKELVRVGMPEEQAEVLVLFQAKLLDERLATKADLVSLETGINSKLASLSKDLTIRTGWMIAASVGVLATIQAL